jgi:hypothetical protein
VTKNLRIASDKLRLGPRPGVEKLETFLLTFSTLCHENHVVLMEWKLILVRLYGGTLKEYGLAPEEMSEDQFQRKRQLCQEVIQVLNKITPGRNPDRGIMLYEYYLTLHFMVKRNMVSGPKMKISCQTTLLKCLKEALIIFNDSPKGSLHRDRAKFIESNGSIADCELTLTRLWNSTSWT